jgi:peptidyl-prolyl cis-trans isomerase B (cyclophilin B)
MSKAPRGRRIPPKGRASRAAVPGELDAFDAAPENESAEERAARTTRAQNRAAKRAASGVRPRAVRGGQVRGRATRQMNVGLLFLALAAVAIGAGVFAFGNPFGGPADGTCPTSQPYPLAASETKYVSIETEKGAIVIEVPGSLSPIAGGNFVALAECEYYDGVVFHRTPLLQSGTPFVIQGGDPEGTGLGGPGYTIEDEPVSTAYRRGTVAMARTQAPDSQGSQFFIVLSDEAGTILQSANTYAIFGEVVLGMDVADAIFEASGGKELPTDPIAMTQVTVSDEPPPTPAVPTVAPTGVPTAAPTQ